MINERNFFNEHGYVIFKQLINENEISLVLKNFDFFIKKSGIYYSQSNNHWRKTIDETDECGLLKKSMLDFTSLLFAPKLADAGRRILLSKVIENSLKKISGFNEDFCMWQNMFFDKSIGTVDHIDTWFLDTDPMGHLIGAWVALEDIDGRGGSFHVYPGSHKMNGLDWKNLTHDQFVEWSYETSKKHKKFSAHLKKGDVLFWHPSLLHGSSNQKVNGFSRKSLTAHYHPISFRRGGGGVETNIHTNIYKKSITNTMSKMKKFNNLPIYATNEWEVAKFSIKGMIKHYTGYKNSQHSLMQRNAYVFKK
jgi:phytanoyl-CoA hydroxylase